MKTSRERKDFEKKLQEFTSKNKHIFDIAACKCVDFSLCPCKKDHKVPTEERPFLIDQRTSRKMFVQGIDHKTTKRLQKRQKRQQQAKHRFEQYLEVDKPSTSTTECKEIGDEISTESSDDCGAEYECEDKPKKPALKSGQLRIKLPSLARTCDRFRVSDRAGAAIASAALQDFGVITHESSRQK